MRTVLVTGPIGSGKSEVCRYLQTRGFPVYDCDSRTKALYTSVPGLKSRIEQALEIEWKDIAVIFTDTLRRRKLESIVYPYVTDDIRAWKAGLDAPLAFVESAIALDKPQFDGLYDMVLLVRAPYCLRLGRNVSVAQRDILQDFDLSRVDYIIENDSTIGELYSKTDKLLCKLI